MDGIIPIMSMNRIRTKLFVYKYNLIMELNILIFVNIIS